MRVFERALLFIFIAGALSGVFLLGVDLYPHITGKEANIHFSFGERKAQAEEEFNTLPVVPAVPEKIELGHIQPFRQAHNTLMASEKPFVEINYEKMEIHYYDGSGTMTTTPIRMTGDATGWGGTPAGLYTVLEKNELAYSAVAEAYMPMALHFYGKYFVHGEPYYEGGEKILSDASGGCIQLKDSDAIAFFAKVKVGTPVLVVDKNYDEFAYPDRTAPLPGLSAASFLVADLDSGEILAEKNSTNVYSIASITKLMTAVVIAEHTDLRKSTLATRDMIELGYSGTNGLVPGETYRLVELLYPLLIESSNDASEVLTSFMGRTRTIKLMNEKASNLFMDSTTYVEPSGYDEHNQSTARDLYLLGRYIANNRAPILDITKGKIVTTFGALRFQPNTLKNKNEFQYDPSFIGGKTGFINLSKNTGLFMFNVTIDGTPRRIAIVILRSDALHNDTASLKNWVTQTYK